MRKLFLFVVGMLFMFTACQKDELSVMANGEKLADGLCHNK